MIVDLNKVLTLAINFGPLGLVIAYLIQRENAERKERLELAKDEIASRERLTSVLTALYIAVTGKPYV